MPKWPKWTIERVYILDGRSGEMIVAAETKVLI